ncbi:MmyB family transcriptional regulator [Streptomyces rochei]|uniref:MmyB family transcriptional regulator n=1 Tax=Streptomyces rochei TaxID=1928 RepID=UPI00379A4581
MGRGRGRLRRRSPHDHRGRHRQPPVRRTRRRARTEQSAVPHPVGRHDVRDLTGGTTTVHHPVVGELRLHRDKLPIEDVLLVVYYPDKDSDSDEKLHLLAALSSTGTASEGSCNVAKSGGPGSTSGGWSSCCQGTRRPGSE